jgi:hypothetical protein
MITIPDALQSLCPGAEWVLRGNDYSGLEWLDKVQTQPTEAEIQAEVARLQAEYDAKEYQRLRAPEYPDLADFADAYYWSQNGDDTKMTEYLQKISDVKDKYPKV